MCICVCRAGKSSVLMAKSINSILANRITAGLIITKSNASQEQFERIEIYEGGHPIPDSRSLLATEKLLTLISHYSKNNEKNLIINLLSGGASALLERLREDSDISLSDLQAMNRALLMAGADISETNTLRKHISAVKAGQLANSLTQCNDSTLITLIVSDVIGNDVSIIGSAPTAADPTTFEHCQQLLSKFKLTEHHQFPQSVINYISKGLSNSQLETPKQLDSNKIRNVLIGSNLLCLQAAQRRAKQLGYSCIILSDRIQGDTAELAKFYSSVALSVANNGLPIARPACIVAAGESTVTIPLDKQNQGQGGRNQHLALATALQLDKQLSYNNNNFSICGCFCASDGNDFTQAAGAIITNNTVSNAKSLGLIAQDYFDNYDSFNFFNQYDALNTSNSRSHLQLQEGSNVMDFHIILIQ
jgi:glycerate 2-kinase